MDYASEVIALRDGRQLEVATMGDPSGPTVAFHHGTPGAAPQFTVFAPILEHAAVFVVMTSRAGYGPSTRLAGRDVAAVVDDTRAALDHVGRGEYVAAGWSGGGPHALACAALDAPRCRGALSIAGVAPFDADFDWTEGMGPENVEEFKLAREGGPVYEATMATVAEILATAQGDDVIELFGGLLSDPDREVLAAEARREEFVASLRHGLTGEWRGFLDDDQAFLKPWGFRVEDIAVPVALFFGGRDLMVPASHGRWLGTHVPGASVHHFPDDGHLSVFVRHFGALAEVLTSLGATGEAA